MKIVLSKDNVFTVIQALDLYSRIFIGQYDHLNWDIRLNADQKKIGWKEVEDLEIKRTFVFRKVRDIIIPDLAFFDFYASHGIWNFDKNDPRAIDAYDMKQTIRYVAAWFMNPQGGVSVDFTKPWIRGRYPEVIAEISGNRNDYQMTVTFLPEQFRILQEAAEVFVHVRRQEFEKLFSIYTDNMKALELAKEAEQYNAVLIKDADASAAKLIETLNKQKGETE